MVGFGRGSLGSVARSVVDHVILFNYLNDFYTAYLDNIIIYSKNKLEYKEYIYKAGLQANIKKLEFSVKRTKYLGFIISTDRIKADLEKTAVIN